MMLALSSVSTILDKNWCSQNRFICAQRNNLSEKKLKRASIFFKKIRLLGENVLTVVVKPSFNVSANELFEFFFRKLYKNS